MDRFREALLNNLDDARRMIKEEGIDINQCYNSYPCTFLQFAILHNNLRAVQFLIEQGVDTTPSSRWMDPLSAVNLSDQTDASYDVVTLLLEKGADCNTENSNGATLFLLALESMSPKTIQSFLNHGADITKRDKVGGTAFDYALRNPQVGVIQCILDQGFDIESSDSYGNSILHNAAYRNKFQACELLLTNGANVQRKNRYNETPLIRALSNYVSDPTSTVRVLLEHGANATDTLEDGSALRIAANRWYGSSANPLIQEMAKMEYLNLGTINQMDGQIIENRDDFRELYKGCLQELQDMKVAKFYNDVSVHDIFLGSKKVISRYAKNDELVAALERVGCYTRFPIYFVSLGVKFYVEVERQRMRRTAAKILCDLFKFNDPLHIINQKILDYMRADVLEFLVRCVPG